MKEESFCWKITSCSLS